MIKTPSFWLCDSSQTRIQLDFAYVYIEDMALIYLKCMVLHASPEMRTVSQLVLGLSQ